MSRRTGGRGEDTHAMAAALAKALDGLRAVGTSPTERLAWLNRFLKRDDLAQTDRCHEAAREIHAFLTHHYRSWGATVNTVVDEGLESPVLPTQVPAIQSGLRETIGRLEPGGSAVWLPSAIGDGLVWPEKRGITLITRTSGLPQLLAATLELLGRFDGKLGKCESPSCRNFFVKGRSHGRHCSRTCASRERVRRKRERDGGAKLSDARHQRYVRDLQKKIPSTRVVVGRRRRGRAE